MLLTNERVFLAPTAIITSIKIHLFYNVNLMGILVACAIA